MYKIQRTVFLILFLASVLLAASTQAADNSCRIVGSTQNDVWVIIYDSDVDGNRNQIIYKGKIEAGKEISITSTDGHIRYNRASDPSQPYDGDESRACYGNNIITAD